ncbi:CoA transferase [Actibacterium sp. MT2.3-13A]|uniref:CaiB/BaiF CoA transferase family protein n=1 Tax=Actibacterium sp. MT2.3-13A TaxID=2828332 RepID=UPI001BAD7989|nr:CoA transferase [Actibacterium sp. MT2.3-13A]
MARAFDGLRVIDTTHVLAGPFAAYQMAVLGAEVIKIEDPNDPDQARMQGTDRVLTDAKMGTAFLAQGSNKKAVALDLKTEAGRAALLRLVDEADVFVENYRPGAFEALGLGHEVLRARNPGLVYCSISAFGATGPRRAQTGYDNVIQAFCGMMAMTGTPGGPALRCGAPVIDYATGTTAAFAITAALFHRTRTGQGQHVDVSMLDVALMLMSAPAAGFLWNGVHPEAAGNDFFFATLGCYDTLDEPIMIAASNLAQQERLWRALGRDDLIRQDNNARLDAHAEEKSALSTILATRGAADWEEFFIARRIPAARVRRLEEALADPQLRARGVFQRHRVPGHSLDGLTVPVAGFTMSACPPRLEFPPQPVGAQTADILSADGQTEADGD